MQIGCLEKAKSEKLKEKEEGFFFFFIMPVVQATEYLSYGCFEKIKFFILFLLGMYSTVALWLAFFQTLDKETQFSRSLPGTRCVAFLSETKRWADREPNTTAGFYVSGGKYRVAICTDKNESELDARFLDEYGAETFDPLSEMTETKCSFSNDNQSIARLALCSTSSESYSCTDVMNANPPPWGAAWSYTITDGGCPEEAGANSTFQCCAKYEYNKELGICPYKTVKLYEKRNHLVQLILFVGSVIPLLAWWWEIIDIRTFSNEYGEHFGDLIWLGCTSDGYLGGAYFFYRMCRGGSSLSHVPYPTGLQSTRSFVVALLTVLVAVIGMWGCAWTRNPILLTLFIVTAIKVVYHFYRWSRRCCGKKQQEDGSPDEADAPGGKKLEKKISNIAVVSTSTGTSQMIAEEDQPPVVPLDPELLHEAYIFVHSANANIIARWKEILTAWKDSNFPQKDNPSLPMFLVYFESQVKKGNSSSMEQHSKDECARLTTIIHRPTTDPGIRSFCITWRDIVIEIGKLSRPDDVASVSSSELLKVTSAIHNSFAMNGGSNPLLVPSPSSGVFQSGSFSTPPQPVHQAWGPSQQPPHLPVGPPGAPFVPPPMCPQGPAPFQAPPILPGPMPQQQGVALPLQAQYSGTFVAPPPPQPQGGYPYPAQRQPPPEQQMYLQEV